MKTIIFDIKIGNMQIMPMCEIEEVPNINIGHKMIAIHFFNKDKQSECFDARCTYDNGNSKTSLFRVLEEPLTIESITWNGVDCVWIDLVGDIKCYNDLELLDFVE